MSVAINKRERSKRNYHIPNPKSTPKEIVGSHGHRPAGTSILWPALYRHLRQKGMTKRKAAMISNGQWRKKRGLPPKSVPGSKGKIPIGKNKLYYFEGRNTAVYASSPEEARRKKKRGGDKIVAVRTPTAQERKEMRAGRWVRTRRDGKSPAKSSVGHGRGYGPPRVSKLSKDAGKHRDADSDGKVHEGTPMEHPLAPVFPGGAWMQRKPGEGYAQRQMLRPKGVWPKAKPRKREPWRGRDDDDVPQKRSYNRKSPGPLPKDRMRRTVRTSGVIGDLGVRDELEAVLDGLKNRDELQMFQDRVALLVQLAGKKQDAPAAEVLEKLRAMKMLSKMMPAPSDVLVPEPVMLPKRRQKKTNRQKRKRTKLLLGEDLVRKDAGKHRDADNDAKVHEGTPMEHPLSPAEAAKKAAQKAYRARQRGIKGSRNKVGVERKLGQATKASPRKKKAAAQVADNLDKIGLGHLDANERTDFFLELLKEDPVGNNGTKYRLTEINKIVKKLGFKRNREGDVRPFKAPEGPHRPGKKSKRGGQVGDPVGEAAIRRGGKGSQPQQTPQKPAQVVPGKLIRSKVQQQAQAERERREEAARRAIERRRKEFLQRQEEARKRPKGKQMPKADKKDIEKALSPAHRRALISSLLRAAKSWNEALHPRDAKGRFRRKLGAKQGAPFRGRGEGGDGSPADIRENFRRIGLGDLNNLGRSAVRRQKAVRMHEGRDGSRFSQNMRDAAAELGLIGARTRAGGKKPKPSLPPPPSRPKKKGGLPPPPPRPKPSAPADPGRKAKMKAIPADRWKKAKKAVVFEVQPGWNQNAARAALDAFDPDKDVLLIGVGKAKLFQAVEEMRDLAERAGFEVGYQDARELQFGRDKGFKGKVFAVQIGNLDPESAPIAQSGGMIDQILNDPNASMGRKPIVWHVGPDFRQFGDGHERNVEHNTLLEAAKKKVPAGARGVPAKAKAKKKGPLTRAEEAARKASLIRQRQQGVGVKRTPEQLAVEKHLDSGGDFVDLPEKANIYKALKDGDVKGVSIVADLHKRSEGGGISGGFIVKWKDKQYVVKPQQKMVPSSDALNEKVGADLKGILDGDKNRQKVHLIGEADNPDVAVVMEHVEDWYKRRGVDVKPGSAEKSAYTPGGRDHTITVANPEEIVRTAILDYVLNQADRHQGNYMFLQDKDRNYYIAAIDWGFIGEDAHNMDFPGEPAKWSDLHYEQANWESINERRRNFTPSEYRQALPVNRQINMSEHAKHNYKGRESEAVDAVSDMMADLNDRYDDMIDYLETRRDSLDPKADAWHQADMLIDQITRRIDHLNGMDDAEIAQVLLFNDKPKGRIKE